MWMSPCRSAWFEGLKFEEGDFQAKVFLEKTPIIMIFENPKTVLQLITDKLLEVRNFCFQKFKQIFRLFHLIFPSLLKMLRLAEPPKIPDNSFNLLTESSLKCH